MKTAMLFSAALAAATCAGASGSAKMAGFAMRLDDNHSPVQWREVASIFEEQGMRASFAVISGKLSDEQGRCLADLAARGHEMMDHTPQHAMFRITYPDDRMFAAAKGAPWVAETDPANRTIYCKPELDFSHKSVFRFRGAIRGGELVGVESALAKRLTFSRKFFDLSTGKGYGISKIDGERRFLLDFWRRPVTEDVSEREFTFFDQAAITTSKDLRRAQAALTRYHFDRFGIPRPTMWIQPGGWEAFLDWRRLKEVYGDEFGYIGGDAVVGGSHWNGCFCDPEPVRGRWSFKPRFGYFDEAVTLGEVKRQVADSVALGRSFIFISHMSARRLAGGWDEWLRSTREFAVWLRTAKIPVMTVSQLNRYVFDGTFSADNVFPSLRTDRDGDGNPDGVKLEKGAGCDLAAGTVRLGKEQRVLVDGLCGLARGANELSFTAVGEPGTKVGVTVIQQHRGGRLAPEKKSFVLGADGRCACRMPVDVKPLCVGVAISFAADASVVLSEPSFGPKAR